MERLESALDADFRRQAGRATRRTIPLELACDENCRGHHPKESIRLGTAFLGLGALPR